MRQTCIDCVDWCDTHCQRVTYSNYTTSRLSGLYLVLIETSGQGKPAETRHHYSKRSRAGIIYRITRGTHFKWFIWPDLYHIVTFEPRAKSIYLTSTSRYILYTPSTYCTLQVVARYLLGSVVRQLSAFGTSYSCAKIVGENNGIQIPRILQLATF